MTRHQLRKKDGKNASPKHYSKKEEKLLQIFFIAKIFMQISSINSIEALLTT
jgi:hypothetical protein